MSLEEEMRAALGSFVVEAGELLTEMETGLLELEGGPDDEIVNSVFRAAHTVKGSSGLFGLDHIVKFTHVVESVLDRLRDKEISVSPDLIGALLPCKDHVQTLIEGVGEGITTGSPETDAAGAVLLARLQPYLSGSGSADAASDSAADATLGPTDDSGPETAAEGTSTETSDGAMGHGYHLSLRFGIDTLRSGMDPLSFIRYLATLGEIVHVTTVTDLMPVADDLDPECCYLDFEVTLRTDAAIDAVEGVFDFVREDSDIRVLPVPGPPGPFLELVDSFGEHRGRIADILLGTGAITEAALSGPSPAPTASAPTASAPTAPAPEAASAPEPAAPAAALVPVPREAEKAPLNRRATDRPGAESQSIRVDADRLDRLIDAVGELVIAGAGASLRASLTGDEALETSLGEVMRLVEEVRDGALQLRMVPIGTTFSRFTRVVRDVSAQLGKDVSLLISGGDTEVDKALVEQIGDPLMHLVRNALDHGIEAPAARAEKGKPGRGTLRLNAYHDSGSIVIEVQDDGNGVNRDRVLAKAIERGLVDPAAVLSDKDIYQLIFEPGFSTADVVSDLSGRGVGMDVVKRNVTALRGSIDVESRPGEGTTFRIRLPLTLAIIDGFLVGVGGATFVIPLDRVVECVELPISTVTDSRRDFMDLRGEVLPFIQLRSLFHVPGERPRRQNVVVVEYAGTKTGLVVDTLKGEFQTVIKPLGRLFENVQGIGGSTILGNGDVALIIDVPMLVRHSTEEQAPRLVRSA